ncbi:MAG TPA: DUF4892 domain-containing protein [Rhodanobacteraceae bacterium]
MSFRTLLCLVLLLVLSEFATRALAGTIPTQDVPGSHDSPLVSRFPGATVIGYQSTDFDQVELPLGKFSDRGGKFSKTKAVAGKVTRIAYAAPARKSVFEVYHSYQSALARAGFSTLYECSDDSCADKSGTNDLLADDRLTEAFPPDDVIDGMTRAANNSSYRNSMINTLQCIGGDGTFKLLTAHLHRAQGNVDLTLMACKSSGNPVGVYLEIVEAKPMASGEVTVNAKAMQQGLAQQGHIALYGIHFATDSAKLAADSNATITQMVSLLKSQPALKVYIVGHTDDTGTLAHNLVLSQQRADSVVNALEKRGIAASRLAAKGLASYAPVASNDNEAGRAQNRRVELVKQ